jgi:antitoxin MazE
MRVFKWNGGLAVCLPREVAEELSLEPGDEVEIKAVGETMFAIEKRDRRAEFLDAMKQFRFETPPDYKFDRDEANER